MRASVEFGARSLSQYSQFGRSSRATLNLPPSRLLGSELGPRYREWQRRPAMPEMLRTLRPLQNRVDPFGEFHSVADRGALMGNRGGRLHRDDRTLRGRRWASKRWIACVCAFRGRRRSVWGAGYTELFFLDEPTALAAGHRPCFECRRAAAKAFLSAFPGGPNLGADGMDGILHRERLDAGRKRIWRARLGELSDGAMIARNGRAYALRGATLRPWSFSGYGAGVRRKPDLEVDVLTPPSSAAALAAGYRPAWAEPFNTSP